MPLYMLRPREDREDELRVAGYVEYGDTQLAVIRAGDEDSARQAARQHTDKQLWLDPELVACVDLADLLDGPTPTVLATGEGTG